MYYKPTWWPQYSTTHVNWLSWKVLWIILDSLCWTVHSETLYLRNIMNNQNIWSKFIFLQMVVTMHDQVIMITELTKECSNICLVTVFHVDFIKDDSYALYRMIFTNYCTSLFSLINSVETFILVYNIIVLLQTPYFLKAVLVSSKSR